MNEKTTANTRRVHRLTDVHLAGFEPANHQIPISSVVSNKYKIEVVYEH